MSKFIVHRSARAGAIAGGSVVALALGVNIALGITMSGARARFTVADGLGIIGIAGCGIVGGGAVGGAVGFFLGPTRLSIIHAGCAGAVSGFGIASYLRLICYNCD